MPNVTHQYKIYIQKYNKNRNIHTRKSITKGSSKYFKS